MLLQRNKRLLLLFLQPKKVLIYISISFNPPTPLFKGEFTPATFQGEIHSCQFIVGTTSKYISGYPFHTLPILQTKIIGTFVVLKFYSGKINLLSNGTYIK